MNAQAEPIYIEKMAELLDRAVHTVRQWIKELPPELQPQREGGRQKIYWTRDQVDGMKDFSEQKLDKRGWQHNGE